MQEHYTAYRKWQHFIVVCFETLIASSSTLHIKIQVNGLSKPVEKDKKTSTSDRVFPCGPHLWVRRKISISMEMNAISSTVSVLLCF